MFQDLAYNAQNKDKSSGELSNFFLNYLNKDTAKLKSQAQAGAAAFGAPIQSPGLSLGGAPSPGLSLGGAPSPAPPLGAPIEPTPSSLNYLKPSGSGEFIMNQPNSEAPRRNGFIDLANGDKDKSNGNLAGIGKSLLSGAGGAGGAGALLGGL